MATVDLRLFPWEFWRLTPRELLLRAEGETRWWERWFGKPPEPSTPEEARAFADRLGLQRGPVDHGDDR